MITIVFIAGILIGSIITVAIFQRTKVGTLIVDVSDPYESPYLFLELSKTVNVVTSKKYVVLKVAINNRLTRK